MTAAQHNAFLGNPCGETARGVSHQEEKSPQAGVAPVAAFHTRDSDCTGIRPWNADDPASDECTICSVTHGTPCVECGQRGFHAPGCPELVEIASEDKALSAQDFFYEQAGDR